MKKILVIEDEPEMRRNLATILRMEHFHPLSAENGRVGVELARKEKPDVILCDVMMPELDGYGVIAELRANPATAAIPFIFLTAKGEKPDVRAGMNLGADDYLTKPFYIEELIARRGDEEVTLAWLADRLVDVSPDLFRTTRRLVVDATSDESRADGVRGSTLQAWRASSATGGASPSGPSAATWCTRCRACSWWST